MRIDGLGELTADEHIEEWLASKPVPVPYFDGLPLRFAFVGLSYDPTPEEFSDAFASFMKLTPNDRKAASTFVYKNYKEFMDAVEPEHLECEIVTPEDVWEHVCPTEVFVGRRHRRDRKVYVQITAECTWEQEHGLQVAYRDGRTLSRVSDQDGHLTHTDAYAVPESDDRIC